jgi:enamine deaminase RidA (YjgF/YER057c/UK114 family)
MDRYEDRVRSLGYRFAMEAPPRPFDRVKVVSDIAYVSGHGPTDPEGRLTAVGRVPTDVSMEDAYQAARLVAVNCLASLKGALGSLERVEEVIKVLAFVNSAPDFHQQPRVANGFTDLLLEVFGERGRHARSAIGTSNLPNNQVVEVEMIVRVRLGSTDDSA